MAKTSRDNGAKNSAVRSLGRRSPNIRNDDQCIRRVTMFTPSRYAPSGMIRGERVASRLRSEKQISPICKRQSATSTGGRKWRARASVERKKGIQQIRIKLVKRCLDHSTPQFGQ